MDHLGDLHRTTGVTQKPPACSVARVGATGQQADPTCRICAKHRWTGPVQFVGSAWMSVPAVESGGQTFTLGANDSDANPAVRLGSAFRMFWSNIFRIEPVRTI